MDPASTVNNSWDDRFVLEAWIEVELPIVKERSFSKSGRMRFQKYLKMFTSRLWLTRRPNVWGLYYICTFRYWKIAFKCLFSRSSGWVRNAIWKVHPSRQLLEKGGAIAREECLELPLLLKGAVVKIRTNIRMAQEVLWWIDSFLESWSIEYMYMFTQYNCDKL